LIAVQAQFPHQLLIPSRLLRLVLELFQDDGVREHDVPPDVINSVGKLRQQGGNYRTPRQRDRLSKAFAACA
jgi:hypothetical protein